MAIPQLLSCEAGGFNCENNSISGGKYESRGRNKVVLGGSIAFAFVASVILGFFVLGPLFQNATMDAESLDRSHSNTLGKFALSNARPLSAMATSGVKSAARTAEVEMAARKAAPKKVAKKAAPKKVAKKAAPKRVAKKAAPKRVAVKKSAPKTLTPKGGLFSIFENGPGMLQKKSGTDRFLDRKFEPDNFDLYFYGSKPKGRNIFPYTNK